MVSIYKRKKRRGRTNLLQEPMLLLYGVVTGVLLLAVLIRIVSFI